MSSPQPALLKEDGRHFHFLEFALRSATKSAELCAALRSWQENLTKVSSLIAFGPKAWQDLASDELQPKGLANFAALEAGNRRMPASQRDLLFYISSEERDHAFTAAMGIRDALQSLANMELSVPGFTYLDSRDLTGFIDGSANPKGEARIEVACIPEGQPAAGGSHMLTQRWVHDLAGWQQLSEQEQVNIIGRTKAESIELEGDAMPSDSHVARTDAKRDGVPQKIYRKSAPFGDLHDDGLYFIAFTCERERFDYLLARMMGSTGDEQRDRLMQYSQPSSGAYWFAPSQEALHQVLSGARS